MPRASHRLDLALVPTEAARPPDRAAWEALLARWRAEGLLVEGRPGPRADALIPGGFARLWLDEPGRLTLYANQQGGYSARCPSCEALLTAAFSAALQRWREGGPDQLRCPACGLALPLARATLAPPGAFARFAVILADVSALEPEPDALRALEAALGPLRRILRRVG